MEEVEFTTFFERLKRGDPAAYAELIRRYRLRLYCVVTACFRKCGLSDGPDDAIQNTLLCLFRSLPKLSASSFSSFNAFGGWLDAVARYRAFDEYRRRNPYAALPDGDEVAITVEAADARSEALDESARLRRLVAALSELNPNFRDVVEEFYFKGKKLAEIAHARGVSEDTVRSWHRRALQRLRAALGDTDGPGGGAPACPAPTDPFPSPGPAPSEEKA